MNSFEKRFDDKIKSYDKDGGFIVYIEGYDNQDLNTDLMLQFFKEELKRITDEIKSKKKVDNKLGSTDLTLGEMFDRGLNSGYTQSIDIIKNNLT